MQDTSFAPRTHRAVISRTVRKPALLTALKTPVVCYAAAIDFDSNVSNTAACTLYVKDTVVPQIRLVPPTDTVNPVSSPVTVMALVTSAVGIDSVLFNNARMVYNNDTALYIASLLDSGLHVDSVVAIDKAGKKSKLTFSLYIQGKHNVPPQIIDLSRATPQGRSFAPIFLDTCVVIADTSVKNVAAYAKDSLLWEIRDSMGLLVPYDLNTHAFTIPFPADTMWQGTFKLTFNVYVKNNPPLYDTKQPSFFVTPFNYPPVITLAPHRCFKYFRADTIDLDTITSAHDPNDQLSTLQWTFSNGNHFKVQKQYSSTFRLPKSAANPIIDPGLIIRPSYFNYKIVIDTISGADATYFGIDSLTFTVTDPGGLAVSKKIYFNHYNLICLF